ncbi:hypothetical protein ENSA5_58320 [Enhygromyxa salina]|uniref:Right handed beta helix domain-containing protein n=1 Tax=Enhygromyxa salina TaxID=215803 RepID=A0A2S9XE04_9BACT|nr:right-handed parallel beta-helix repeat-containing protein [Enhygromyxa salina]PRP91095.1 hypothetical protein ENSA5_58320 [Enhygromyxa salina]
MHDVVHEKSWRLGLERALLAAAVLLGGAGCKGEGDDGADAGTIGGTDAGTGGATDAGTDEGTDAGTDAGTDTGPGPVDGPCGWEQGERPSAELPSTHDNAYTINLAQWMIDNDGGDPVETRQRMNEAIAWAVEDGFDKVIVPPGRYVVGELTNDIYAAGIVLPGDMTLELSDGAIIEMTPNDRHNYCVISVEGNDNITIRGGMIRGDRADHDYSGGANDEGHGVCVWTSADRILIEDTELTELTGDGVLIVGSAPKDDDPDAEVPSTNITIRNNEIHHNRRNGVSIVGGHNVVIANNHIHHMEGTAPQFGIDIEGVHRRDQDILIFQNNFHDNVGGDFVTSTGRNVWLEENTMTQCQVNEQGEYDAALPCENDQIDGPIVLWQNTDTIVINNEIRMTAGSVNGLWGIINYPNVSEAVRDNPVGNYIAGNTFYGCGIHSAWNRLQHIANNTIHEGTLLAYLLECTRLENNRINRVSGERFKLRNVAGQAEGNIINRDEGAPPSGDVPVHFPMSDDSPYRNSSPVFW